MMTLEELLDLIYHNVPPGIYSMLANRNLFDCASIGEDYVWSPAKRFQGLSEQVFHIFVLE